MNSTELQLSTKCTMWVFMSLPKMRLELWLERCVLDLRVHRQPIMIGKNHNIGYWIICIMIDIATRSFFAASHPNFPNLCCNYVGSDRHKHWDERVDGRAWEQANYVLGIRWHLPGRFYCITWVQQSDIMCCLSEVISYGRDVSAVVSDKYCLHLSVRGSASSWPVWTLQSCHVPRVPIGSTKTQTLAGLFRMESWRTQRCTSEATLTATTN